MISPCHASRSRYALFRLLSRFGIGCRIKDDVDERLVIASSRQNRLEAWAIGTSFYVIYGLLALALIDEFLSPPLLTMIALIPLTAFVAFLIILGAIATASVVIRLIAPGSNRDASRQPSRQATAQQLILLAICLAALGWESWFRWVAIGWVVLVAVNAVIAMVVPPAPHTEENLQLDLRS